MPEIRVEPETIELLGKFARPFEDHDTVIRRVIALANVAGDPDVEGPGGQSRRVTSTANGADADPGQSRRVFQAGRGWVLPSGLKLRSRYRGSVVEAEVTEAGIEYCGCLYQTVSAAATAVKELAGVRPPNSNTNGWVFWSYTDPATGRWRPLEDFRRNATPSDRPTHL